MATKKRAAKRKKPSRKSNMDIQLEKFMDAVNQLNAAVNKLGKLSLCIMCGRPCSGER